MREERERAVCCLRVSVWRAARRYDNTGRQAEWAAGTVGEECGMCGSGSVEEDNNRGRSAFLKSRVLVCGVSESDGTMSIVSMC